ncbi:hypothetical protein Xcel_2228 [Xylanimonas cellulosilytica DSM 15894]|uniref:Polyketide cyclase/dehydrase n=1 Tax=Xylanimonas cellulosilytica (strain DSM 15894 / JCM 12276 / CECT 5975 / KCTC 9989 / LMG 20990 / NBRC 107835 / XIL07) TaxID=446471 RepID=D1BV07_XYLCX|nr:hypothetical protein [Xylanimonas cellulosilytica]ACZ31246.1 hypothetical protein Xcel_2228 [Xylanimonas cellulosilytica DSM 15894]
MRKFHLVSRWHVDAPVDAVWDVLADPAFTWPSWWPALSADDVVASGGRTAERWSRVRLRVRSPLGWSLHVGLVLESACEPAAGPPVQAGRALLRASGDLVGTGAVVVVRLPAPLPDGDDDGGATEVTLTWSVGLARAGVTGRLLGLLPRWVLTAAHGAVMRSGERGLRARVGAAAVSRTSGRWTSGATSPPRRSGAAPP